VAHILEHLAFRSTKNYKNHAVVSELESFGVKFGAHQNAYTDFSQTVYELCIPLLKPYMMRKCLEILREMVLNISFTESDLDCERNVVLEEWRQGSMGDGRASENYWSTIFHGSLYKDRFPIGESSIIQKVSAFTVQQFYRRWYQPSNMAVVVVGDFEGDVKELINELFCKQSLFELNPLLFESVPEPLVSCRLPPHDIPLVAIYQDAELTSQCLTVESKVQARCICTHEDLRDELLTDLFYRCLNSRLYKISLIENPPFLTADASSSAITPCSSLNGVSVTTGLGVVPMFNALTSILFEMLRIVHDGFEPDEITLMKSEIYSETCQTITEKDQIDSSEWASDCVDHFLLGNALVPPEDKGLITQKMLASITPSEVSSYINRFSLQRNLVVQIQTHKGMVPWMTSILIPVIHRILRWAEEQKNVPHRFRCFFDEYNITRPIALGSFSIPKYDGNAIVLETELEDGLVLFQLVNGLEVVVKSTYFRDDQILFEGFAWGGLSEVKVEQLVSAQLSTTLVRELGMFGVPSSEFIDMMTGYRISFGTDIDKYYRAFGGQTSPDDFQTAMLLVHKLFTSSVETNDVVLGTILSHLKEREKMEGCSPMSRFSDFCESVNTGDHPFFRKHTAKDIDSIDATFACRFFTQCFSDPKDFKLVICGKVDMDSIRNFLCRFLGTIPNSVDKIESRSRQDITPVNVSFPDRVIRRELQLSMVEENCASCISFPITVGPYLDSSSLFEKREKRMHDILLLPLCSSLLEARLLRLLRFELGSVYGVNVSCTLTHTPPNASTVLPAKGVCKIAFTCKPGDHDTLSDRIHSALNAICSHYPPTSGEVSAVVKIAQQDQEIDIMTNEYWIDTYLAAFRSPRFEGDMYKCYEELAIARRVVFGSISSDMIARLFAEIFLRETCIYTNLTLVGKKRSLSSWIKASGILGCTFLALVLVKKR